MLRKLGEGRVRDSMNYKAKTVKYLYDNYPQLGAYSKNDIIRIYSIYCDLFYAASWTSVDMGDFVKWALTPPIMYYNEKGR